VTARTPVCVLLCAALLFPAAVVSPAWAAEAGLEEVFLTLEDCLRLALENNLDLVSARYDPDLAAQDVIIQGADFDPNVEATLDRAESAAPTTLLIQAASSDTTTANAAVTQNLKFGADYRFGYGMNRSAQDGPGVNVPLQFTSGFNVVFNMPLLKGFGTTVTTENFVLARNNYNISKSDLEGTAEQTMETVIGAYWNVVAARAALGVALQTLERAEDLLELNRKKVEVGTLAPIEITQAEAEVARNEELVIIAETDLEDIEDELRRLLAIPPSDPMWNMSIMNATRPTFEEKTIDLDEVIEVALASRSEMLVAEQSLQNRELGERAAQRNVRHQLDLALDYSPRGASQTRFALNPTPPPESIMVDGPADVGESVSRIFDGDQFQWTAGLVYRVPIGNKAAKANYTKARINREKSEADLRDQAQTIRVEVRRAVRGVKSGTKRIEAARANVVLQAKKLDAEQKKFENGMSTSFEVLTFQNDLAEAELSEIQARLEYIKSIAALER